MFDYCTMLVVDDDEEEEEEDDDYQTTLLHVLSFEYDRMNTLYAVEIKGESAKETEEDGEFKSRKSN